MRNALIEKNEFYASLSAEDKTFLLLKESIDKIKKSLEILKQDKIIEKLKLPDEIYKNSGEYKLTAAYHRKLTKEEILDAKSKCKNANKCAEYLKVSFFVYRKWAKFYDIWKLPNSGRKEYRYYFMDSGKHPLSQILLGKFPDYPIHMLKHRLFVSGIKKVECEQCGYSDRRIPDDAIPLLVNFEDGDSRNHKLENLRILCYNCTFCYGNGFKYTHRQSYGLLFK